MNFFVLSGVIVSMIAFLGEYTFAEYQSGQGNVNSLTPGGGGGAVNRQGNVFIPILKDERTHTPQGEYSFTFESANGIQRQEVGSQSDGSIVQGGWSYTSPEGIPIMITFVADQGGYQAQGDSIPIPVPLPYMREQQFVH